MLWKQSCLTAGVGSSLLSPHTATPTSFCAAAVGSWSSHLQYFVVSAAAPAADVIFIMSHIDLQPDSAAS